MRNAAVLDPERPALDDKSRVGLIAGIEEQIAACEIALLGADRQHAQGGRPQQAQCGDAFEQGYIIFDRHAEPGAPLRIVARIVSWHQLVATGFRHQYLGIGRIFLDLLTQPVDVGFQGVGGDA